MNIDITHTQAHARDALANILACLRRRSKRRHAHITKLVGSMDFFWLAEVAGYDPHLVRMAFRQELAQIAAEGLGLKGKGRVRTARIL